MGGAGSGGAGMGRDATSSHPCSRRYSSSSPTMALGLNDRRAEELNWPLCRGRSLPRRLVGPPALNMASRGTRGRERRRRELPGRRGARDGQSEEGEEESRAQVRSGGQPTRWQRRDGPRCPARQALRPSTEAHGAEGAAGARARRTPAPRNAREPSPPYCTQAQLAANKRASKKVSKANRHEFKAQKKALRREAKQIRQQAAQLRQSSSAATADEPDELGAPVAPAVGAGQGTAGFKFDLPPPRGAAAGSST